MVELGKQTTEDLQSVIHRAVKESRDAEAVTKAITNMVAVSLRELTTETLAANTPREDEGFVIYDELPPGLIDLPTARTKYGKALPTMAQWVRKGYVTKKGLRRGSARGGGYIVVDEDELVRYMNGPRNKGGRPRKKHK